MMKIFLLALTLVAGAALIAASKAPPPAPSFTTDQARRGQLSYYENCAECHGAKSQGLYGPALVGPDGNVQWETVQYVYQYALSQMPAGNAGGLPKKTYVDIMAYLLQAHGHRPGSKPLTAAIANTSLAVFGPPQP